MAKGRKKSLAARGLALLFALALVALAAKLWLGGATREDASGAAVATERSPANGQFNRRLLRNRP